MTNPIPPPFRGQRWRPANRPNQAPNGIPDAPGYNWKTTGFRTTPRTRTTPMGPSGPNQAHSGQPGRSGGSRGSQAAGIFGSAADAVQHAANQLADPKNALTAVDALEAAADFLDTVADVFDRVGAAILETVWFAPEVVGYFEDLGKYVRQAAAMTREGSVAVQAAHQAEIDRINENDPKKRKWDLGAHGD